MESKIRKKLYLVSREVWAVDVAEAIIAKGKVYKVEIADDKYQPEETKPIGFNKS